MSKTHRDSYLTHLECGGCGAFYEPAHLHNLCPACGRPLLPRYDLAAARAAVPRESLTTRPPTLWRYGELLPVQDPAFRLTLGEGFTPLLPLHRLGTALGLNALFAKDEGINPTGSFKARGLAVAVSRALELGATALAIPSAGNAGSAAAAYAARADLPLHVFLPRDVPPPFIAEMEMLGARISLVDGLITDCGRLVRQGADEGRWFDLSTLKEPYRVEGKKTMGYELAEQMDWHLPDVIIYPTGGGTGIVGIWKAFEEMEALGWIGSRRPRMIAVQSAGCAPIVRAYREGAEIAVPFSNAATIADGLRVPAAVGDILILRVIRQSGGIALSVSDGEILASWRDLGHLEGMFVAPEAAATLAGLRHLLAAGLVQPDERIVLLITGSGLKYTHLRV